MGRTPLEIRMRFGDRREALRGCEVGGNRHARAHLDGLGVFHVFADIFRRIRKPVRIFEKPGPRAGNAFPADRRRFRAGERGVPLRQRIRLRNHRPHPGRHRVPCERGEHGRSGQAFHRTLGARRTAEKEFRTHHGDHRRGFRKTSDQGSETRVQIVVCLGLNSLGRSN